MEEVHIVKRYSNRKLYSTKLKKFINVVDVCDFALKERVKVIDDETGKDITASVLTNGVLKYLKAKGVSLKIVSLVHIAALEHHKNLWKSVKKRLTKKTSKSDFANEIRITLEKTIEIVNDSPWRKELEDVVDTLKEALNKLHKHLS